MRTVKTVESLEIGEGMRTMRFDVERDDADELGMVTLYPDAKSKSTAVTISAEDLERLAAAIFYLRRSSMRVCQDHGYYEKTGPKGYECPVCHPAKETEAATA